MTLSEIQNWTVDQLNVGLKIAKHTNDGEAFFAITAEVKRRIVEPEQAELAGLPPDLLAVLDCTPAVSELDLEKLGRSIESLDDNEVAQPLTKGTK